MKKIKIEIYVDPTGEDPQVNTIVYEVIPSVGWQTVDEFVFGDSAEVDTDFLTELDIAVPENAAV